MSDPTGDWSRYDGPVVSGLAKQIFDVAYGDGLWVAVGRAFDTTTFAFTPVVLTATSAEGPWTETASITSSGFFPVGIAYGDGTWAAIGNSNSSGYSVYSTTDPTTGGWSSGVGPGDGNFIYYDGTYWGATASDETHTGTCFWTATSPTGTWTHRYNIPSDDGFPSHRLDRANGTWIVAMTTYGSYETRVYSATNPTTGWALRATISIPAVATPAFGSIGYSATDGYFLAGYPGVYKATSLAGTWTEVLDSTWFGTTPVYAYLAYGDGNYVAHLVTGSETSRAITVRTATDIDSTFTPSDISNSATGSTSDRAAVFANDEWVIAGSSDFVSTNPTRASLWTPEGLADGWGLVLS